MNKKSLKGIQIDSQNCFLWLNEEEILRMSSAIVDAYLYSGARIYTTKYIEPNVQEASKVTYEPSVSTLLLIEKDPNIVNTAANSLSKQVRKAMENRLAQSMNTKVEEIDWELSPNRILAKEENSAVEQEGKREEATEGIPDDPIEAENTTYQAERMDKEAEMDYGP